MPHPKLPPNEVLKRSDGVLHVKASNNDCVFMIDESDEGVLKLGAWRAYSFGAAGFYIETRISRKRFFLHRVLLGVSDPKVYVDHKNRNPLDCTRGNLREASASQNCRNRRMRKGNRSGFKGVSFHRDTGKYQAEVVAGSTRIYLGLFKTAEEAAKAYDKKAKELHGEYAALNCELK